MKVLVTDSKGARSELQIAQEAATDVLLVDLRGRAPHVEVDARDGAA